MENIDLQLAILADAAYDTKPTFQTNDCFVTLTTIDEFDIYAFRGTNPLSFNDWLTDFDFIRQIDPDLGVCASGWLDNVNSIMPLILNSLSGRKIMLSGHSKGAAEAALTCGKLIVAGHMPCYMGTCGMPRPTYDDKLGKVIDIIPGFDNWDGDDPVPDVPFDGIHPRKMRSIGHFHLDPIDAHLMSNYIPAIKALQ